MRDARSMPSRSLALPGSGSTPGLALALAFLLAGCAAGTEEGAGPPATGGAPAPTAGSRAGAGGSGGSTAGSGGSSGGQPGGAAGAGGATGGAPAPGRDGAAGGGARDAGVRAADATNRDAARDGAVDRAAASGPFALSSSAFDPDGIIMRRYRCSYEDVSPPLSWTPGPAGTRSYAITMRSAGSPHWALWDIAADVTSLPEKIERLATPPVPAGSKQCKPNVDGSTWYGYAGACPMGGTNLRPYYFELYALRVDQLPGVSPESNIRAVNAALMANQVGVARLTVMASPTSP